MPQDAIQRRFEVGQVVNVPCIVTAVGGDGAEPTVTMTTKYAGFNGNTDTVGPLDANQVIVDQ